VIQRDAAEALPGGAYLMLSQHITMASRNDERNHCTMHARLQKMIVLFH